MIEALIIFLLGTCSHITSSVSCLMFHRNKRMSALQYLISTILRDSGAKKTAFRRLNRMGLTVSAENQRLKTKQMICSIVRDGLRGGVAPACCAWR